MANKKKQKNSTKNTGAEKNTRFIRLASYLALIVYIAGIYCRTSASSLGLSQNQNDLNTMGTLFDVSEWLGYIFVLASLYVASRLSWRYWPFRSVIILNKLDERQKEMRSKAVEWGYRAFGVWALLTLMFGGLEGDRTRGYVVWMLIGLFFFMPSLVAAHRKGA